VSEVQRSFPSHAAMDQFPVADGELVVGGMALTRLAARVGQTPFYAYDRSLLTRRVGELRAVLPSVLKLHYAMKANPMPALVCHMAGLVDGIDVASGGELKVALDAGANPRDISFAGPGKQQGAELRQAVAAGILINVESFREVAELASHQRTDGQQGPRRSACEPRFRTEEFGNEDGRRCQAVRRRRRAGARTAHRDRPRRAVLRGLPPLRRLAESQAEAIVEAQSKRARPRPAPRPRSALAGSFPQPRRRLRHSLLPRRTALDLAPIGAGLATISERAAKELPASGTGH
jgi:diaminopimelate decarboxylase